MVRSSCLCPSLRVHPDDAQAAQLAVRQEIPCWCPCHHGHRLCRLERVDVIAALGPRHFQPRTLAAATHHIVAVPAEACKVSASRTHTRARICPLTRTIDPPLGHHLLRLRTGPSILVTVRWHVHFAVSHSAIMASEPPVARWRPVGLKATVRHSDVWPRSANSAPVVSLSSSAVPWLATAPAKLPRKHGSRSGNDSILVRPSLDAANSFLPLQQNARSLVLAGCRFVTIGAGCVGDNTCRSFS